MNQHIIFHGSMENSFSNNSGPVQAFVVGSTVNTRHAVFLLDKSSSMSSLSDDLFDKLVAAVNAFREKIAVAAPNTKLVLFHFSDTVCGPQHMSIQSVVPRWHCAGDTALLDAVKEALRVQPLGSITLMTDGVENASKCMETEEGKRKLCKQLDAFKADGGEIIVFGPHGKIPLLEPYITADERLTEEESKCSYRVQMDCMAHRVLSSNSTRRAADRTNGM